MLPDAALELLKSAVSAFLARDREAMTTAGRGEELAEVRCLIDSLEVDFSSSARTFQVRGGHLADGAPSAVSWIGRVCNMSSTSVSDRLCVGRNLEGLPQTAKAVVSGEIGYQSASILCHFREQLGEEVDFDEAQMLGYAKEFRFGQFRELCHRAWHAINPDTFEKFREEDFERRWLKVSSLQNGMHAIDGVLDAAGSAAVCTALEALASERGPEDQRTRRQRMADALVELAHHALDAGSLPSRGGVRPHITLTTTLAGLKGELGAPASDLEHTLPISSKTLQRFACDCTMSRVLLADSEVVDVGRATRAVSGPPRRALRARDKRCRFPGCDRPIGWTTPHHIEFWSRGGPSNLPNLASLCYFHHRLVHEGGWQVVKAGKELHFERPAA